MLIVTFLRIWNHIISRRGSSLLSKQVNIFTTNIDPIVEGVAEDLGGRVHNGFKGMMRPAFREEAFSSIVSKVSPLYQRTSELPTFNYLKMHGSVNWRHKENSAEIFYDGSLDILKKVVGCIKEYPPQHRVIEPQKPGFDLKALEMAVKNSIGSVAPESLEGRDIEEEILLNL